MRDEWGDGGDHHLRVTPSPSHAVTLSSQVGWNAPLINCHGARWQMEAVALAQRGVTSSGRDGEAAQVVI
jgi:hypothetical protein